MEPENEIGPNDVAGGGIECRPDGTIWKIVFYGDGRREETLL